MTRIAKLHESIPASRRGKRVAALSDAQRAAAWLNQANKDTAAYRNIRGLYAHLNRLDDLLSGRAEPTAKNEWFVRQEAINDLLDRYSFKPCIARDPDGKRRYLAEPRRIDGPIVEVSDGRLSLTVSEPMVAAILARLYAAEELFHVHLCDHCSAVWHARVRQMDRFCSREHQVAYYTSSDESRERNRKAQEKHRASEGYLAFSSPKKGTK